MCLTCDLSTSFPPYHASPLIGFPGSSAGFSLRVPKRSYSRNLYAFFCVITRRLEFMCRRFGTLCLFHLHRQVDVRHIFLPMKMEQSVPKRRHINSRWRVITLKKAYKMCFLSMQTHPYLHNLKLCNFRLL